MRSYAALHLVDESMSSSTVATHIPYCI